MAILQNTNLKGKRVLVTGSSNGIGLAIAKSYLKEGCKVILNGRNKNKLDNTVLEIGSPYAHGIVGDVTKPKDVKIMFKKMETILGGLDILINNAGINLDSLTIRLTEENWKKVLDINLTSTFLMCKFAIKKMLKNKSGKIVNITSVVGHTGNLGQANYTASKSAIIGLSKSLAIEYAKKKD